uniref:Putative secreted protein n=1 Tax=Ixodes ricinus TaxID=34613 RepID=A0A147BSS3_IXORI
MECMTATAYKGRLRSLSCFLCVETSVSLVLYCDQLVADRPVFTHNVNKPRKRRSHFDVLVHPYKPPFGSCGKLYCNSNSLIGRSSCMCHGDIC